MSSEQLFANGRLAVMSSRMLGKDKFLRLAECASPEEALHVLGEFSYGEGAATSGADFEGVLRAELDCVMRDIKQLCTNAHALGFLLCKYDYHNAKVLMKGKYMRQDLTQYCFRNARFDADEMRERFNCDDYSPFGKIMAEACDAVDAEFADGCRTPQVIDRLLDKACFRDMQRHAKASLSRLTDKLADLQTDAANLMLIRRIASMGGDSAQLELWLVDGGTLKSKTLAALFEGKLSQEELPEKYRPFLTGADERYLSKLRRQLIDQYDDPLTVQPALKYFFAKVEETELLRLILADIKNGTDKEKIKEKINAK